MTGNPEGRPGPVAETDSPPSERRSKGGRKYVRKGFGNGGRRPGAGRPLGTRNALPVGTVQALDSARIARRRLGKDADPEDVAALEYVYRRVGDVLAEKVSYRLAAAVLKGSGMAADALAGPIVQKTELGAPGGGPLEVIIRDLGAEE